MNIDTISHHTPEAAFRQGSAVDFETCQTGRGPDTNICRQLPGADKRLMVCTQGRPGFGTIRATPRLLTW